MVKRAEPQPKDRGLWMAARASARPSTRGPGRQPAGLWMASTTPTSTSALLARRKVLLPTGARAGLKVQTAVRRLQQDRAAARRAKLLLRMTQVRAEGLPRLGHSLLEDQSVAPTTKRDYLRRVAVFLDYVAHEHLPLDTAGAVDGALVSFLNQLARDGEPYAEATRLRAAWAALHPEYSLAGSLKLPRTFRALRGYARLAPETGRLALPEEALDALTVELVRRRKVAMALELQLHFSAYLRPSEGYGLAIGDLVPPVPGAGFPMDRWTLHLSPFERGMPTKTRHFDEAIALDDKRCPWLGAALGRLQAERMQALRRERMTQEEILEAPLWPHSRHDWLEVVRGAAQKLEILWAIPTAYVLRHGGATRDAVRGLRDLPAIMRRGRWAHLDSIRHYEKHGRLQASLHKMGRYVIDLGRQGRRQYQAWSQAGCPQKGL